MTDDEDLEAAFLELAAPRFDWVHPSWRDVVIEHLMTHPADRRRFLSRCGVDGLALALSVSGGQAGERQLPLLQRPSDWTATRVRAVQLVPSISSSDRHRLLAALRGLSETVSGTPLQAEADRLQREVLETIVGTWNSESAPLRVESLELLYAVTLEAPPLVPGPNLDVTWTELSEQLEASSIFHPRDADDALHFLSVAAKNEPRFLRQIGWPDRFQASIEALVASLSEFRASVESDAEALTTGEGEAPSDPEDLSAEAYLNSRTAGWLADLGVADRDLGREIKNAERSVDSWLARRAEEEADREQEDFVDAEDESESPPAEFDLDGLFGDL